MRSARKRRKLKPAPMYHVVTIVDGTERGQTYKSSIQELFSNFGRRIVRFIPLNELAWEEVHKIAEMPEEEWLRIRDKYKNVIQYEIYVRDANGQVTCLNEWHKVDSNTIDAEFEDWIQDIERNEEGYWKDGEKYVLFYHPVGDCDDVVEREVVGGFKK